MFVHTHTHTQTYGCLSIYLSIYLSHQEYVYFSVWMRVFVSSSSHDITLEVCLNNRITKDLPYHRSNTNMNEAILSLNNFNLNGWYFLQTKRYTMHIPLQLIFMPPMKWKIFKNTSTLKLTKTASFKLDIEMICSSFTEEKKENLIS